MKNFFLIIIAFIYATVISATETLTLAQQTEAVNAVKSYFSTLQEYARNPMGEEGLQLSNDIVLMFENLTNTPVYNDLIFDKKDNTTDVSCTIEDYLLELGILSEEKEGDIHISYSNINCRTILEPSHAEGYDDMNALVSVDKSITMGNRQEKITNIIRYNIKKKKISYVEKKSLSTSKSDINLLLSNHQAYSISKLNEIASLCYTEEKFEEAYKIYEKAAIRGDLNSQLSLAKLLYHGTGCKKYSKFVTIQMAKFWIKKIYFNYLKSGIILKEDIDTETRYMCKLLYGEKWKLNEDLESKPFNSGFMRYNESQEKIYFFNERGENVFRKYFIEAQAFSEGLAAVSKRDKYGYMNSQGKIVIPMKYDYATPFINGTASVGIYKEIKGKKKRIYYMINKEGNKISDEFDYISWRDNKDELLIVAQRNDKYGFINGFGEIKIPFVFDEYSKPRPSAKSKSDHLIKVLMNNKYGFVDTSLDDGIISIVPQFDNASLFLNGRAFVKNETKGYYINKKGEKVSDYYKKGSLFKADGFAVVEPIDEEDSTLRYIIDKKGNILFYANESSNGYLTMSKLDHWRMRMQLDEIK